MDKDITQKKIDIMQKSTELVKEFETLLQKTRHTYNSVEITTAYINLGQLDYWLGRALLVEVPVREQPAPKEVKFGNGKQAIANKR